MIVDRYQSHSNSGMRYRRSGAESITSGEKCRSTRKIRNCSPRQASEQRSCSRARPAAGNSPNDTDRAPAEQDAAHGAGVTETRPPPPKAIPKHQSATSTPLPHQAFLISLPAGRRESTPAEPLPGCIAGPAARSTPQRTPALDRAVDEGGPRRS